ncbi:MAG: hypothetical protein LBK61_00915 [Spirochaetaceae bacterium]|jgi:predicted outer membrane repeat protein|nr:hypothetical protein [Spirochaetaceae bacterium]
MNNKKRLWLCFVVATGCAVLFGGCEVVSSLFGGGGGEGGSEGGPSGGPVDNFDPSIPSFYVSAEEGKEDNNGTSESEPLATLKAAYDKAKGDSERRRIVVLSDLTQAVAVEFNAPGDFITIEGRYAGYTIGRSAGKNGSVLEITGGAKIKFANIKVNGRNGSVYNRAIKIDGAGSEATLEQGAVLTGELVATDGAEIISDLTLNGNGVWVTNSGTLTIAEGEVAGCQGAVSVGAVFANAGGSVSMAGGWIRGNTAYRGGGVAVYQNAAFTMTGGEISGNTGISGGGGIYAFGDNTYSDKRPTLDLKDGKILSNHASTGGGVYILYEINKFTITNVVISNNNATTDNGGGINITNSKAGGIVKMSMTGGRISDNTASSRGGGIYVTGTGIITMKDGHISGNKAFGDSGGKGGGGVFVGYINANNNSTSFIMDGGEISGNYAFMQGGGVFIYPGSSNSPGYTNSFTLKGDATVYGSDVPSLANSVGTGSGSEGAAIHKYSNGATTKVIIETTDCTPYTKQSFEDTVDTSYKNP